MKRYFLVSTAFGKHIHVEHWMVAKDILQATEMIPSMVFAWEHYKTHRLTPTSLADATEMKFEEIDEALARTIVTIDKDRNLGNVTDWPIGAMCERCATILDADRLP